MSISVHIEHFQKIFTPVSQMAFWNCEDLRRNVRRGGGGGGWGWRGSSLGIPNAFSDGARGEVQA